MTSVKHKKVKKALCKKGFKSDERHHTYFNLVVDGVQTDITTYLSIHGKESAPGR